MAMAVPEQAAGQRAIVQALKEQQSQHEAFLQQLLSEHLRKITELLQSSTIGRRATESKSVNAPTALAPDAQKTDKKGMPQFEIVESNSKLRTSADAVQDEHMNKLQLNKVEDDMRKLRSQISWKTKASAVSKESSKTKIQRLASKLCQYVPFQRLISFLIVSNGAIIGIQADYTVTNLNVGVPLFFRVADVLFVTAFTFELVVRILAEGRFFCSGDNPLFRWNILDSMLVLAALTDEIINASVQGTDMDMSAARILRLLRLVRAIRMIRVMRVFKQLRVMIMGVISASVSLLWACVLLLMIIYVFAICIMQFVTDHLVNRSEENGSALHKHFASLTRTCYTLFMCISGGLSWVEVSEPLIGVSPALGFAFCGYIAFAVFCVLNIITGVFVETALQHTATDDEQVMLEEIERRQKWIEEIRLAFARADCDGSGELELKEFLAVAEDTQVQIIMNKLGVDMRSSKPESIFMLFDQDRDGRIKVDEFATAIQHMHGPARSLDVARLLHQNKSIRHQLNQLMGVVRAPATQVSATATVPVFVQASAEEHTDVSQPGCVTLD